MKLDQEIRTQIFADLKTEVGGVVFDRWLASLAFTERSGGLPANSDGPSELRFSPLAGEVQIGFPNTFWLQWVEKRYLGVIVTVVRRHLGSDVAVTLGIDPVLFQKLRREQETLLGDVSRGFSDLSAPSGPAQAAGREPPGAMNNGTGSRLRGSDTGGGGARVDSGSATGSAPSRESSAANFQTLENFIVGESNQLAHALCRQVVESPGGTYNPLLLHGASGRGKTHLLRGVLHGARRRWPNLRVVFVTAEGFLKGFLGTLYGKGGSQAHSSPRERYSAANVLVIDDVQFLAGKQRTQEEFLSTLADAIERGCQVVIASDVHPKRLQGLLKPLEGRLLSGLPIEVGAPDRAVRREILRQRATRSAARISEEVMEFLVEFACDSVRELLGAFNVVEAHALGSATPLSLESVRRLFRDHTDPGGSELSLSAITQETARVFGYAPSEIVSSSRHRCLTLPRQVAMFLAYRYTGRSLSDVGKHFAGRNHTSVRAACLSVEKRLSSDPALKERVETILARVR